ncbi:MAG TPA: glycosyltransferase [Rickettsiales bacterium]|nr:glycosyltransferase [Rickettsiales bacterium]
MKIGIVSSYDDLCGNASYTKSLESEFKRRGNEVKVFDLVSYIFNTREPVFKHKAKELIESFAKEIENLDYVNLQFEAVLYAPKPKLCLKRVMRLLNSCKDGQFSITFHRLDYTTNYYCSSLNVVNDSNQVLKIKKKKSFSKAIKYIKKFFSKKIDDTDVVNKIIERTIEKNGLMIVHTEREKNYILGNFPKANIVAHPLTINREEDIKLIEKNIKSNDIFSKKHKNIKSIGMFGFLSPYKDFETAITSLKYLPEEYNLYIFGGQHPLSFKKENCGSSYTNSLVRMVNKLNLIDRVHFMGAQETDEKMLKAMVACDYVVVPYLECGQSGSAVASMAIEANQNTFLSRNLCFNELKKYTGESFFAFDMGNAFELAEKIQTLPDKEEIYKNRQKFFEKYNIQTNIDAYLSVLGKE